MSAGILFKKFYNLKADPPWNYLIKKMLKGSRKEIPEEGT